MLKVFEKSSNELENASERCCVLVTAKPWNQDMAVRLHKRTGCQFKLLTSPDQVTVEVLEALQPEYVFFPHWSHKIPQSVFSRFECVIFHMTDLPYGRGGSPLQNLISRKVYETQVTALRCIEELDAGPVYLKKPLSLFGAAEEIYLRAGELVEDMIVEMMSKHPEPAPQIGEATVFARRKPSEGNLATAESLSEVFDLIRMLDADGYPNAFLNIGPFKLEFTRASKKSDQVIADVKISFTDQTIEKNT